MLWFVNGCVWLPSTRHTYQRALDSKTSTTTSTRFSVLSSARVVILAGKRESRRHSKTSFRENVVVAKTSYQLLGILSFSDRDHSGGEKKSSMKRSGVSRMSSSSNLKLSNIYNQNGGRDPFTESVCPPCSHTPVAYGVANSAFHETFSRTWPWKLNWKY